MAAPAAAGRRHVECQALRATAAPGRRPRIQDPSRGPGSGPSRPPGDRPRSRPRPRRSGRAPAARAACERRAGRARRCPATSWRRCPAPPGNLCDHLGPAGRIPASASEWPFRYFVPEWTTRSAPTLGTTAERCRHRVVDHHPGPARGPAAPGPISATATWGLETVSTTAAPLRRGRTDRAAGRRHRRTPCRPVRAGSSRSGRTAGSTTTRPPAGEQLHAGADGRHARGEAVRRFGALQFSHGGCQLVGVGVADAAVEVAPAASAITSANSSADSNAAMVAVHRQDGGSPGHGSSPGSRSRPPCTASVSGRRSVTGSTRRSG